MAENGKHQDIKSKFQVVIDHLDNANKEMGLAMNVLGSITFDLQKGADFIQRYRDSLIKTVQELGGETTTPTLEQQMREYIPPRHRESPDA